MVGAGSLPSHLSVLGSRAADGRSQNRTDLRRALKHPFSLCDGVIGIGRGDGLNLQVYFGFLSGMIPSAVAIDR